MPKKYVTILTSGGQTKPLDLAHAQRFIDMYKKQGRLRELSIKEDNREIDSNGDIILINKSNKGTNNES